MSHPSRLPSLPALEKLIEAFDQFLEEYEYVLDGSLATTCNDVTEALGLGDQVEVPVPVPLAFIMSLPKLDPLELREDRRECGICLQPLHSASKQEEDRKLEVAVELPCRHDCLGVRCLLGVVHSVQRSQQQHLSVCFGKFPDEDTIEGLQTLVDIFDYGLQNGLIKSPETPHPPEREEVKEVKTWILEHWLDKANVEADFIRIRTARDG